MGSFNFGSLLTAAQNAGITGTTLTSLISSVGSLNSVSSQVDSNLTQLAALLNNPSAYAAAAPTIITKIESINGVPATVLPLLEKLRTTTDPLQVSQLISQIEATVAAQSSIL
jgi:hypothetical protein